jgi:hypothetical protein
MNQTTILAKVNSILGPAPNGFGTSMSVYKYTTSQQPRPNPYGYGTAQFADPISVTGRATFKPTPEIISKYGGSEKRYDIMFVWAITELRTKFPTAIDATWVTVNDRVAYENNTYLVNHVKPTARLQDEYSMVVAFGTTEKGTQLKGP